MVYKVGCFCGHLVSQIHTSMKQYITKLPKMVTIFMNLSPQEKVVFFKPQSNGRIKLNALKV